MNVPIIVGWVLIATAFLVFGYAIVGYIRSARMRMDMMGSSINFDITWLLGGVSLAPGIVLVWNLSWPWSIAVFFIVLLADMPFKLLLQAWVG